MGAAVPLGAAAYAWRAGFGRVRGWVIGHSGLVKQVFGIAIAALGLAILTGLDRQIEARFNDWLPPGWLEKVHDLDLAVEPELPKPYSGTTFPRAESMSSIDLVAAVVFAIALLHTFSVKYFERLAHRSLRNAGLFHLLGEVEVVFGFWAFVQIYIDQRESYTL
eukprot:gene47478-64364_t